MCDRRNVPVPSASLGANVFASLKDDAALDEMPSTARVVKIWSVRAARCAVPTAKYRTTAPV
eukprot:scaffold144119_cov19-Prasinocladus_malaysianus.AAC.1